MPLTKRSRKRRAVHGHGAPSGVGTSSHARRAVVRRERSPGVGSFVARLVMVLALAWFMVGALLSPVVPGGPWLFFGLAVILTALPLSVFLWSRSHGLYPGALFRLAVLRPFWYTQLTLLFSALGGAVATVLGVPFGAAVRTGRIGVLAVATACAVLSLIGYIGSRRLVVRRLTATIAGLPEALDGLTIAQITDTHVGPHTSHRHLARVRRAIEDAAPSIVAVTGDLVDDHAGDVAHFGAALGGIRAPLGVYAIPGNHEVYAGWPAVREALGQLPLTVLVNDARIVTHDGVALAVVGVGDPAAGRRATPNAPAPDIDAALARVPDGMVTIALAHNPALWPALADRGVSLTLSGHTHWAQLALPVHGWSLANAFLQLAMGVYERGDSLLYVHPGTNYWGIPFRIGALPEVALITLRSGDATSMTGPRDRRTLRAGTSAAA